MKKNIENKKPNFVLLILLLGFPQLHEAMLSPSIQNIAQRFTIHINQAQVVLSLYFVAFALGVLFWGYFSDIKGRRTAMISGFVTYIIGTIFSIQSSSFNLFMLGRFVGAFGLATGSVTTQTILREAFSEDIRNKLFSQVSIALALVPGIGPIIGGALVDRGGVQILLIFLVLASLLIVGLAYYRLPETMTKTERKHVNILAVLKRMASSKNVLIYGFFIASYNAIMSIYYMEVPLLFASHFDMTLSKIGTYGIYLAIATIVGALATQRLLKRYSPQRIILIGNGVVLMGAVMMLLVGGLKEPLAIKPLLYIMGMIVIRFGTAMALSNAISLSLNGFEDVYGTAGSLLSLGYYLSISGLMRIMSFIRTDSLTTMPIYFIILGIVLIVISYRIDKKESI